MYSTYDSEKKNKAYVLSVRWKKEKNRKDKNACVISKKKRT
jgi:hypothetical protein